MSSTTHHLYTADGKPLYTSSQVATRLGMTRNALMVLLQRHNEARPLRKVEPDLFWTEDEIVNAQAIKATAKRGRPAKA